MSYRFNRYEDVGRQLAEMVRRLEALEEYVHRKAATHPVTQTGGSLPSLIIVKDLRTALLVGEAGGPAGVRLSGTELAGYSGGTTKEWWADAATGKLYAGAGAVILDAGGVHYRGDASLVFFEDAAGVLRGYMQSNATGLYLVSVITAPLWLSGQKVVPAVDNLPLGDPVNKPWGDIYSSGRFLMTPTSWVIPHDAFSHAQRDLRAAMIENGDLFRWKIPTDVEYWDGAAWVAWGQSFANVVDGRHGYMDATYVTIDYTHRKCRFVIDTAATGYKPGQYMVIAGLWPNYTVTVTVETSADKVSWTQRYNGSALVGYRMCFVTAEWGTHRYARVTFDVPLAPGQTWGCTGVSCYTTLADPSTKLPISWNAYKDISGLRNLAITGGLTVGASEVITSARKLQNIDAIDQSLIPDDDDIYMLGTAPKRWWKAYIDIIEADHLHVGGVDVTPTQRGHVTTDAGTGLATINFTTAFAAKPVVQLTPEGDRVIAAITGWVTDGGGNYTGVTVKTRLQSIATQADPGHAHNCGAATSTVAVGSSGHTHTNPATGGPSASNTVATGSHGHGATSSEAPNNPHFHTVSGAPTETIGAASETHTHTQGATGAPSSTETVAASGHGHMVDGGSHQHDIANPVVSAVVHWLAMAA